MREMEGGLTKNNAFFSNRQLLSLMLPLIMEQFLAIFVGFADSLMVSFVGEAAISAVSLVDSISNLMIYVFSAMAAGGAVVAGQYMGHGDEEKARRAGEQMMALLAAFSLVIMALLYLFRDGLLALLFGEIAPDVLAATNTYYIITIASIPAIAIYNGGAAIFRTMSRSDISLKASLLMNLLNVGGNAVLIYGLGMGVEGAAIPTLLSRVVAAAVMVVLLLDRRYVLHLCGLRTYRPERKLLRNIFLLAVPGGIENGMFHLGRLVLVSMVATLGTAEIAANAVGNTFGNIHCFPGMGINMGLATVISCCVGAGEYEEAKRYFGKILRWSYVVMAAMNGVILLLTPMILRVYDLSPEAAEHACTVMVMHGIASIVLWVPAFMIPGFLRAAGDAGYTMLASVGSMWLVRVLFAYIFGIVMGYGLAGIWFAHSVLDWIVRSVLYYYRYRSGRWQLKRIKT